MPPRLIGLAITWVRGWDQLDALDLLRGVTIFESVAFSVHSVHVQTEQRRLLLENKTDVLLSMTY